MPEVGRGEVLIIPDLSRFGRDLERGIGPHIDRAGRSMESTFGTAGKRSAESVEAAFKRTAGGIDIPLHVDTSHLPAELRSEVSPILSRVDADVAIGADTGGFGTDLRRGVDPHLRPVDVPVEPDTSAFRRLPADLRPHVARAGDELEQGLASSAKGASKAIVGAIGVGLVAGFGRQLLDLGTQAAVFRQKTAVVFEDSADDVRRWAADNAKALGLTETRLAGVAAGFGDLLKPMGFTAAEAAKMSTETVALAGALSAWSEEQDTAADVSRILAAAMLGEREALKGLGISITEADVQTRLALKGQQDLTGAARQQAEALATQELIFEKSTDAQKAWADGSFEAIIAQNELRSKIDTLVETMAEKLLPVFSGAADVLTKIPQPALEATAALAAIGGAAVGINAAVGAVRGLPGPLLAVAGTAAALYGVKKGLDALGVSAQGVELDVGRLAKATGDELVRAFLKAEEIGQGGAVFGAILGESVSEAQRVVDALKGAGIETGKYQKAVNEAIESHRAAAAAKDKDAKVTGQLGTETGKLGQVVGRARDEMDKYTAELEAAYGASQNLVGSQLSVADAVNALRDSAAESAGRERELAEAIRTHGRASAEAQVAGEALEDARRRQLADVDSLAQANTRLAEVQATAAGRTLSDADKYRIYRDELIRVKDTLAPDAPLRKHLEGLINSLPPPVIKSQVVIDTAKATAEIAKFLPLVESLQSRFGGSLSGKFLPTRHSGGPVTGPADEVPILAQRGEYVLQRSAVDALGVPALEVLNRFHSGGMVEPSIAGLVPKVPALASMPNLSMDVEMAGGAGATADGPAVQWRDVIFNGVRDGEEAASLLPMRLRTELFLVGG